MDWVLQNELRPGEQVVWEGKPAKIQLLNPPYHKIILKHWLFCLMMVAFGIWYSVYAREIDIAPSKVADVGVLIFLLAFYFSIRPYLDIVRLHQKFHYYVTDQRFIVYKKNGLNYRIQYRDFSDITEITLDMQNNGNYNVFLGPLSKDIYMHSRNDISSLDHLHCRFETIVFCNISDASMQILYRLLPLHMKISKIGQRDQRGRKVPPDFAPGEYHAKYN